MMNHHARSIRLADALRKVLGDDAPDVVDDIRDRDGDLIENIYLTQNLGELTLAALRCDMDMAIRNVGTNEARINVYSDLGCFSDFINNNDIKAAACEALTQALEAYCGLPPWKDGE